MSRCRTYTASEFKPNQLIKICSYFNYMTFNSQSMFNPITFIAHFKYLSMCVLLQLNCLVCGQL